MMVTFKYNVHYVARSLLRLRISRQDHFSDIVFIFRVSFAMNIFEISHDFEVSKSLKSIAKLKKFSGYDIVL